MAKRTYFRRQSKEEIDAIHKILAWKFEDNDVLFSIEKFETWRFLMHIKSNGVLHRAWMNNGRSLGKVTYLYIEEK